MIPARKLTFQEAWQSTVSFFIDDDLENEIDNEVNHLLQVAALEPPWHGRTTETAHVATYLASHRDAVEVILRDVELSEEKLQRIISLLRRIGRIPGGFDQEWNIERIKTKIVREPDFATLIADLLMDGVQDTELARYIPRYYLETLNYRHILGSPVEARRLRYKRALIGTYGGKKGYRVEGRIEAHLQRLGAIHGVAFEQGRSHLVDTNLDFAIPGVADPWIIIMSSFQETTSSGQSAKTRDMFSGFQNLQRRNSIHGEDRVFVNFVDGGGWLARKRDFQRLIENCHYFLNLAHLDMLESIVLQHLPGQYGARPQQA